MGQIWAKFCYLTMGRGVECGAKEIFWQFLKSSEPFDGQNGLKTVVLIVSGIPYKYFKDIFLSGARASIPVNIRISRIIHNLLKATKHQAIVQSGRAM